MSVNKWIGIGNLCRDPELRSYDGGKIVNITIACNEKRKGHDDIVEYMRISFFGKLAEIAGQYLKKGSQVYIEGRIRTRKYTDREGIERYATEIIGDRMQMLGSKQDGSTQPAGTKQPAQRNSYAEAKQTGRMPYQHADDDSDIPF